MGQCAGRSIQLKYLLKDLSYTSIFAVHDARSTSRPKTSRNYFTRAGSIEPPGAICYSKIAPETCRGPHQRNGLFVVASDMGEALRRAL